MDTGKGDAREQSESGAQTFPISLHVPGILRLLSEHLYSDPSVALRELIQNAADSCQRRRLETSAVDSYTPHIDLHIDADQRTLVVTDNGSGLARDEIHTYLATIGRGYTAELRERLEVGGRDAAYELIGQFGLGLLAAFLYAVIDPASGSVLFANAGHLPPLVRRRDGRFRRRCTLRRRQRHHR